MTRNDTAIFFRYKGRDGKVSLKKVVPESLEFMATRWHPDKQRWILVARIVGTRKVRHFPLEDCNFLITQ